MVEIGIVWYGKGINWGMLGDDENTYGKTRTLANTEKFGLGIVEVDACGISVFWNFGWKFDKSIGDVKIFFRFRFITNTEIWVEGIIFGGSDLI